MRKHCKRKVYVPRANAALLAIGMQHKLDRSQLDDLGKEIHVGIVRIRTGNGIEQDYHNFAAMVNVSMVLSERGIGDEPENQMIIRDAQEALLRLHERAGRLGKWVLDGPGLQAIKNSVTLFELQINGLTRDSARSAIEEVYRRQAQGRVLKIERTT